MKAMIPVLLMLMLSGCVGGKGGPQNAPPPPQNDGQTCNSTDAGANSNCSQSVVPPMH